MGNQSKDPRAGNAFVSAEKKPDSKPRAKKDIKVFNGVGAVTKKGKTGFLKWASEMLLSGRTLKEIWVDKRDNYLVPEGKNILFNLIVDILSAKIFKEPTSGGYTPSSTSGNFIARYVDYNNLSKKQATNHATQTALAANQEKDKEILKAGYELPIFPNYQSARQFLDSMKAEISRYDTLSVYDVSWKRGKTISYNWEEYGWNKDEILAIPDVSRFRTPMIVEDARGNKQKMTHYIDLPPHHRLTE